MQHLYKLDFTVERTGHSLMSLEVLIEAKFDEKSKNFTEFWLTWKQVVPLEDNLPSQAIKKWVSPKSVNAKYIITCYIPSAAQKCLVYSHNSTHALSSIQKLALILQSSGYPASWWGHILKNVQLKARKGIG